MSDSIEARSLTLRYGDVTAIDDLSFTFEGGKIYGPCWDATGRARPACCPCWRPSGGQLQGRRSSGRPVFENSAATARVCLVRETGDTVEHDWPADRVKHALQFAEGARPDWDADYAEALIERFRLPPRTRISSLSRGNARRWGSPSAWPPAHR